MTETINQQQKEEDPLEKMKDLTAQWANYFNGIQQGSKNHPLILL